MKRKRFKEEQIITVLRKRRAGAKIEDSTCKRGISKVTI